MRERLTASGFVLGVGVHRTTSCVSGRSDLTRKQPDPVLLTYSGLGNFAPSGQIPADCAQSGPGEMLTLM
jgi:hypothetical protein